MTSISPVPDKDGKYVVEIELPHGVRMRYGKELPVMKVMTSTADIVTKEQSLLERLVRTRYLFEALWEILLFCITGRKQWDTMPVIRNQIYFALPFI